MASIEHITIETTESTFGGFYAEALGINTRVRAQVSQAPTDGFRGFILGLVVAQPATVDTFIASALDAGATSLKPPTKSMWGYGGAVHAPDGTVVTFASSSKKNTGPGSREIDELVLQLGVADVAASRQFYTERGFPATKSYGRKYVEFDSGPVSLTLNRRDALAKTVGLSPEGSGSHRLIIGGNIGSLVDPDGYAWE
ncbi:MAG: glyoxalase [Actinomycetota bacterium]|nr:glyoxalase [Actinomycetota bacterium]